MRPFRLRLLINIISGFRDLLILILIIFRIIRFIRCTFRKKEYTGKMSFGNKKNVVRVLKVIKVVRVVEGWMEL